MLSAYNGFMAESESQRWDGLSPVARRFVVLLHSLSDGTHHDLMIDQGAALATWQIPAPLPPFERCIDACRAIRLPDHRRVYLAYEGPVSGGRGEVRQVDAGSCCVWNMSLSSWRIEFHGLMLRGRWSLTCEHGDAWRLQRLPGS